MVLFSDSRFRKDHFMNKVSNCTYETPYGVSRLLLVNWVQNRLAIGQLVALDLVPLNKISSN